MPIATTRELCTALAVAVCAGGTSSSALAARSPTHQEARAVRYALAHDARTCCTGRARIVGIRISSVAGQFAAAQVEWLDAKGRVDQTETALLWRGVQRWAVIDAGSENIGCGLINAAVRRDLMGTALCAH